MPLSILRKCARLTSAFPGQRERKPLLTATSTTQTAKAAKENDDVYSFSFASFDSSMGTLEKVTLALSASVGSVLSFVNASAKHAHITLSSEIVANVKDHQSALCLQSNVSLALKAKVDAGTTYCSPKVTRPLKFPITDYTAPSILSAFCADGGGDMMLCLLCKTAKSFSSFGGSGIYSLKTDLDATLAITYWFRGMAGALS